MTSTGDAAATAGWGTFDAEQVGALTVGPSFFAEPGERDCPGCGQRRLRAYVHAPEQARRPTLVSYVWCTGCHRFVGSRSKLPDRLMFSDPLAGVSGDERRQLERSLAGFLAHLDELWDAGLLPQSFAAA